MSRGRGQAVALLLEAYATIREEALAEEGGKPLRIEVELQIFQGEDEDTLKNAGNFRVEGLRSTEVLCRRSLDR